jgi:hypothetical protein
MTPTPVRRRIGSLRRCTSRHPLWGENTAVLIGDFLKLLLQPDPRKLARFALGFQFQLPQRRHTRLLLFHPFPFG